MIPEPLVRHSKWLVHSLVFFALPLLVILFGLGTIWEHRETAAREGAFRKLDGLLLGMRRYEDPLTLLNQKLWAIAAASQGTSDWTGFLKKAISSLRKQFPKTLEFAVVDRNGDLIPDLSTTDVSSRFLKKFFELQTFPISRDERFQGLQKIWPIMRHYVGQEGTVEQFSRKTGESLSFVMVSIENRKRWFGYWFCPQGAVFVHVNRIPGWPVLGIRTSLRKASRRLGASGIRLGLHDLKGAENPDPGLSIEMGRFLSSGNEHSETTGHLFSFMPVQDTWVLWASMPLPKAADLSFRRRTAALLGILVFSLLTVFSHRVIVRESGFRLSIRQRLVLLFSFAGGGPLLMMTLIGWDYISRLESARKFDHHLEMERILRSFDSRYPQIRGRMEARLTKLLHGRHFETPDDKAWMFEALKRLQGETRPEELMVIDREGKVVHCTVPVDDSQKEIGRNWIGRLGRRVLENLNQDESGPGLEIELIADSVPGLGLTSMMGSMMRDLGKMVHFVFADKSKWMIFLPVYSRAGKATHVVLAFWDDLESAYIGNHLLDMQRQRPDTVFFVCTDGEKFGFPRSFPLLPKIRPFLRGLFLRQASSFSSLKTREKSYLVTGIKGKELGRMFLVAIHDSGILSTEIAALRRKLDLFLVASSMICLFLGLILSQRFLSPIRDLSEGVKAIQGRKFDHFVPTDSHDELGDLARTFNRVLAGLSDLQVARIVQESLAPDREIRLAQYRVSGKTVPAVELGGDYFDIQPLKDGRLLIVIGDVTGHGIQASLVMAMAKGIVEDHLDESPSAEFLLGRLNKVIMRTLKGKRMMTCFIAILDPVSHCLDSANAGHCYPILFRKGETPKMLSKGAFPLGGNRHGKFHIETVQLKPDDRIIFYSDGFIETREWPGDPGGYTALMGDIGNMLKTGATVSVDSIFALQTALPRSGAAEDDVTVVFLHRNG